MTIWPANNNIVALAEPLIKNAEGECLKAYLCPAGKWTIGWGTTYYPSGAKVKQGDTCTPSQAQTYLEFSMAQELRQLETDGAITRAPTAHQAAAFLSIAYNVGLGAHDGVTGDLADSTLFKRFNAGDLTGAAAHFLDWDKAHVHGVLTVLPGLLARRHAESALFLEAA